MKMIAETLDTRCCYLHIVVNKSNSVSQPTVEYSLRVLEEILSGEDGSRATNAILVFAHRYKF